MKIRRIAGLAAAITAGALVLSACGAADAPADQNQADETTNGAEAPDTTDREIDPNAIIRVRGGEPARPLVPSNTMETNGGNVIDQIFSMLVSFDAEGTPRNEVAESIETEDNQHWTITIQDGWTFSDGTPVHAHNFVQAWDQAALLSNGHLASFLFESIEGFSVEEDSLLSENGGLEIVDDLTFKVNLSGRDADFGIRIGHSAFAPLPDVAFNEDGSLIDNLGTSPETTIGNGPYVLDEWINDQVIRLSVREGYDSVRNPQNGGLEFIAFTTMDAAYTALRGGDLDVIDSIPAANIETFMTELDGRGSSAPSAVWQGFTIPSYLDHFGPGEEGNLRRQAISMAFDRQEIVDALFGGTNTPAVDFTAPVIPGFTTELEGQEVLQFNPELAAERWAQADAIRPFEGTFELAYNADGGHGEWVEAVTNQIRNTLGIEAQGRSVPTFAVFREEILAREINAAFRTGWQGMYPSVGYYLSPVFRTGAGSNDGDYSNPEFDALLDEALAAPTPEETLDRFHRAQEILLQDLPQIPLWNGMARGGWGENVGQVQFAWNTVPVFHQIVGFAS